jgi:hypothetical protein
MAASGNVRYSQVRSGDRTGSGNRLVTAASGTLTQNVPLLYDASGNIVATATRTGNTTNYITATAGAKTSGYYPKWDADGNLTTGDSGPSSGGVDGDPPLVADFSWFNQGSATATDSSAGLYLRNVENDNELHGLVKSVPATPWTITVGMRFSQAPPTSSKYPYCGMVISDGTKYIVHGFLGNSGAGLTRSVYVFTESWNTATTLNGTVKAALDIGGSSAPGLGLRITDDGTDRKYYWSFDGTNFELFHTETRTTFLTASQAGLVVRTNSSTTQIVALSCSAWAEA